MRAHNSHCARIRRLSGCTIVKFCLLAKEDFVPFISVVLWYNFKIDRLNLFCVFRVSLPDSKCNVKMGGSY